MYSVRVPSQSKVTHISIHHTLVSSVRSVVQGPIYTYYLYYYTNTRSTAEAGFLIHIMQRTTTIIRNKQGTNGRTVVE